LDIADAIAFADRTNGDILGTCRGLQLRDVPKPCKKR
jgi:hypothetical protein